MSEPKTNRTNKTNNIKKATRQKTNFFKTTTSKTFPALILSLWAIFSIILSHTIASLPNLFFRQTSAPLLFVIFFLFSTLTPLVFIGLPLILFKIPTFKNTKFAKYLKKTFAPQPSTKHIDDISQPKSPSLYFWRKTGFIDLPTWTDIGLAILGFVATMMLSSVLILLLSYLVHFDLNQPQNIGLNYFLSPLDRLIAFILIGILTPISEEIIFRGWLYHHLRLHYRFLPAATITSLIFGFLHGQWNVAIITFSMSFISCFLRELTKTIYAPILLHILKNSIAVIFLFSAFS